MFFELMLQIYRQLLAQVNKIKGCGVLKTCFKTKTMENINKELDLMRKLLVKVSVAPFFPNIFQWTLVKFLQPKVADEDLKGKKDKCDQISFR